MPSGPSTTEPRALELPDTFDPSGIPYLDGGRTETPLIASHRADASLPGLPHRTVLASVEEVAAKGGSDWLVWGSVDDRPVLFAVDAGRAGEMMSSVRTGEMATAIVEPWQVVLERLD